MTNTGSASVPAANSSALVAVVRLGDAERELRAGDVITIGRGSTTTLTIVDPRVSRTHLTVRCYGDDRVEVEDAGTTNGTYCYGRRVQREDVPGTIVYALGGADGPEVTVLMVRSSVGDGALAPIEGPEGVPLTVGRSADNSVTMIDPLVSHHHARLVRRGPAYEVTDLESRNGVEINGTRVTTGTLHPGDRLTIGRTTFQSLEGRLLPEAEKDATLLVEDITFELPNGRKLIQDVSISVPSASLLAVIGPSGAGKSTFLRALTGTTPATSGRVLYAAVDLYQRAASFRERIGVVPQDDVVHRQLTVRQCLDYAAELRLPHDYTAEDRAVEVNRVLADLDLTEHAATPISRLSGGQRKRTSVALELLNEPDLLILDEPTSGLDPHLDRSVMQLLRHQADAGRIVLVVTHNVANLSLCDNVLVLAPGGRVAYFGSPKRLLQHFGVHDYADVFRRVADDPEGCAGAFAAIQRHTQSQTAPAPAAAQPPPPAKKQRRLAQLRTLMRRQFKVVLSDQSYAVATVVLPLVLALMALTIPGGEGFRRPTREAPSEPNQLLVILTVGAAFMGMSASIRELVGERAIFLRERAVGVSSTMYLLSKFCMLTALIAIQSLLLIGAVLIRKPAPDGAALLGNGIVELVVAVFATALASATLGLALSAAVGTSDQVMPVLVVSVMAQLVMCGGLITVTDRTAMEIIAAPFPSRWGYALGAATIDLRTINPAAPQDSLWEHSGGVWALNLGVLAAIIAISLAVALLLLKRRKSSV